MKTIAIIPARGGSKRLPRKNIYPLLGKPLISYAIAACKKAKHINATFVSTEDKEIKQIAKKFDAKIIDRPPRLSKDNIWTQDVLRHAVLHLVDNGVKFDTIARVQANSPMVELEKIDEAIQKLKDHDLWEVFTVNQEGLEDGAIHVLQKDIVFQSALSVYKGVVFTRGYIDIHTKRDINKLEKLWRKQGKK